MKRLIQYFLILLKIILIIFLLLIKFNIIKDSALHIIIELIFYVFLALYIIYISYPFRKNPLILDSHDNILTFALGIIFLLTINYNELINEIKILYNEKINDESISNINIPNHVMNKEQNIKYFLNSVKNRNI